MRAFLCLFVVFIFSKEECHEYQNFQNHSVYKTYPKGLFFFDGQFVSVNQNMT